MQSVQFPTLADLQAHPFWGCPACAHPAFHNLASQPVLRAAYPSRDSQYYALQSAYQELRAQERTNDLCLVHLAQLQDNVAVLRSWVGTYNPEAYQAADLQIEPADFWHSLRNDDFLIDLSLLIEYNLHPLVTARVAIADRLRCLAGSLLPDPHNP